MSGPGAILTRNRDFRWLFGAELVIFGGDWFVMIPLLGLLIKLTGGGLMGSLALAADTGISALLLPYTGTIADRVDRRKILVTANLSAVGAVGLLFFVQSGRTAWLGPVAVGAIAVAKAFAGPAAQAAIPNLVEPADLSAATAMTSTAWGTMTVVGASLGGVLAAAVSPYTCFGITAVCLCAAAGLAYGVRRPMQAPRDHTVSPPRAIEAIRESLRYLRGEPRIRALITVKSAVGLGNGVLVVYPALALLLHAGSLGTGLLFAVRGAGALIGPFLLRGLIRRREGRLFWILAGSMSTYGMAYLLISVTPWFPLILLLILCAHAAGAGNWAMSAAALQAAVPDALRGRVIATDLMLVTIVIASSQVMVGLFVDHAAPRLLVAVCGGVTVLYALVWRLATARLATGAEPADTLSS
ncbi:MAG: MFS transporter [Actinobacteria bacterium 13_2_20CM_2_71_6]|nr:MAG: MFS transporter [Actinobacteria bacterium 13_2_20CM_2_71_6]